MLLTSTSLSNQAHHTLWQMLDAQGLQRGVAPALRFEGESTSYAQLAQQTMAIAATLHAQGIQSGDRVAYLGLNHPLQLALLFACARIGAALVPLNYRLAKPECEALLQDCTPRMIVSDAHGAAQSQALAHANMPHAFLADLASKAIAAPIAVGTAHSAALLVYTSGTTGLPKGTVHTQQNLMRNMHLAVIKPALNAIDSIATMLPLFHVGGLCIQTLPAICAGACVQLHARFDAGAALRSFAQDRPTLTLQVPATMRSLIEHPDWASTDLSSLRAVWAGSSILPAHLVEAFHARGIPVCNVYGSTETGPFSICLPPSHASSHLGSCGWPAGSEVEVKLVNQQAGVGEICIRAPNVAESYWPDIPLKDDEGWFHTGDLARMESDGSYWVVGRNKDMLISGGENIYPAEIENLLASQQDVAECAVIGLPDAQWGEIVAACVVLKPGVNDAEAQRDLSAALALKLARFKLPRRWYFLPELPKTALGKVQKPQLLAQLSPQRKS